jgi:hypothetical protein
MGINPVFQVPGPSASTVKQFRLNRRVPGTGEKMMPNTGVPVVFTRPN